MYANVFFYCQSLFTGLDKHGSLLSYEINYGRNVFYDTGLRKAMHNPGFDLIKLFSINLLPRFCKLDYLTDARCFKTSSLQKRVSKFTKKMKDQHTVVNLITLFKIFIYLQRRKTIVPLMQWPC